MSLGKKRQNVVEDCQERIVLGSRSPRRRELLAQLLPGDQIEIVPPENKEELDFAGRTSWLQILNQVQQIARKKNDDILNQKHWVVDFTNLLDVAGQATTNSTASRNSVGPRCLVLTADTVIVATDAQGTLHVLGQPSADEDWPKTVRTWFRELYAGRNHSAVTAVCLSELIAGALGEAAGVQSLADFEQWDWAGRRAERIVESRVWFRQDVESLLDWYLATGEPIGKAGGYALQGLGSLFVTRVEGSLTNVVGLPLEAVSEMLQTFGWPLSNLSSAEPRE